MPQYEEPSTGDEEDENFSIVITLISKPAATVIICVQPTYSGYIGQMVLDYKRLKKGKGA